MGAAIKKSKVSASARRQIQKPRVKATKAQAKAAISKTSHSPEKPRADVERDYLATLDLREWWEEFISRIRKNGTQRYPTVWSFIKSKAKHKWQKHLLYWHLGPKASEGQSQYPGIAQHDWEEKRQRGFWYSSTNIDKLKSEVKAKHTSFDKLQVAGESLIHDLAELTELNAQVSKEFGGRLFLPENTAAENSARAQLFFQLKKQIQEMKAHILQIYGKTQGLDMNQLTNFLELFATGMGAAASVQLGYGGGKTIEAESKEANQYKNILSQMNDMVIRKSADLELSLPDSEAERIVEETISGNKKKRGIIQ